MGREAVSCSSRTHTRGSSDGPEEKVEGREEESSTFRSPRLVSGTEKKVDFRPRASQDKFLVRSRRLREKLGKINKVRRDEGERRRSVRS